MNTPPSISERVGSVVGSQRTSTARPTQTQVNQYNAAAQEFEQVLAQLRQLIEGDLFARHVLPQLDHGPLTR